MYARVDICKCVNHTKIFENSFGLGDPEGIEHKQAQQQQQKQPRRTLSEMKWVSFVPFYTLHGLGSFVLYLIW